MAGRMVLLITLFLAVAAVFKTMAKSDDSICGMTRDELTECKPAVAAGSATPPVPTQNCCSYLGHANLTCFCQFKKEKYSYYFAFLGINATRAIQLPSICDPTQTVHCAP